MTRQEIRRIGAVLLCIALCLAALFSVEFLSENAGHTCAGTHCPICAQMNFCAGFLRNIAVFGALILLLAAANTFVSSDRQSHHHAYRKFSLVSYKVKFSD